MAYVCSRWTFGIVGSDPAGGLRYSPSAFVGCCVGRRLCDELSVRSELYRVCVSELCVIQKPQQLGDLGPSWAAAPLGGKKGVTYVVEIASVNDIRIFVCSRCAQYVTCSYI